MKSRLAVIFLLATSLLASAQGRGRGPGGGMGQGMGQRQGAPEGTQMRQQQMDRTRSQNMDQMRIQQRLHQGPLNDQAMQSGSFKMMMQKTNRNAEQLRQMYAASGARNYGQFASAVMVSHNLGLDTDKVLAGMKTQSLGRTLQNMGVDKQKANQEISRVRTEMRTADMGTASP